MVHKKRCEMGEIKEETRESASAIAGQTISRRILVAEDNKAVQDGVSAILDSMGFKVALAGNGAEALDAFVDRSFDLVLTDLEMPIMDGWRLTRCIKERSPDTPVVWMTGADKGTVLKKMKREPVASVLFKSFRVKDLQSTVRGALGFKEGEHGNVGVAQGGRY